MTIYKSTRLWQRCPIYLAVFQTGLIYRYIGKPQLHALWTESGSPGGEYK